MEFFKPDLTLVRESDGEYTLIAKTLTPDQSIVAGSGAIGAPDGYPDSTTAVLVRLDLVQSQPAALPVPTLAAHHVSDIPLAGDRTRVVAFAVLQGAVLGRSEVSVSIEYSPDFVASADAIAEATLPTGERFTLAEADAVVRDALPKETRDYPPSATLKSAVGMGPTVRKDFRDRVVSGIRRRNYTISRASKVPSDASDTIGGVRTAVRTHSRRETEV